MDAERIKFLSDLDLAIYAGEVDAITPRNIRLTSEPMNAPGEVRIVAEQGVCEEKLYRIISELTGRHEKFIYLKRAVVNSLMKQAAGPGWNFISVLFDGIYIGEPEDVYNHRKSSGNSSPVYFVRGFGVKIADVEFIDTNYAP